MRSSSGRRRGRSAPRIGPQHNNAKSALRGAHVSWAVGRYSSGRTARGPLVASIVRGGHDLPNLVPPTCRNFGAVELRPTAWGGVCPLLGHNTTMPSPQSGVWRVLLGRLANTRQVEKRAGCAPRDSNGMATTSLKSVPPTCRGGDAAEPRPTALGGAPRVGRQHDHGKSALRGAHVSWAVGRYSTGRKASGPSATRLERSGHNEFKRRAAVLS